MTCRCISNEKKALISVQTALIAFILFSPLAFQLMSKVFGSWVANSYGLPSSGGLLLHALVFGLVIFLLMKPKILRQNEQNRLL